MDKLLQKPSKSLSAEGLARQGLGLLRSDKADQAKAMAQAAINHEPDLAAAWHILALASEQLHDHAGAVEAYQTAIDLEPQTPGPYADLARLMIAIERYAIAEGLLKIHLSLVPDSAATANDLAWAQANQLDTSKAIVTLITALEQHPSQPMLWNTLGLVLMSEGRMDEAVPVLQETLNLDPDFGQTRLALAEALMVTARGDLEVQALALSEGQIAIDTASPDKRANAKVAQAKRFFSLGRLAEGWASYEARHDLTYEDATVFDLPWPRWQAGQAVEGKHVLLIGEQGLGDEIMFSQAVPDLITDLGSEGRLTLAMDPRLVATAQRSFPSAEIIAHTTARRGGLGLRGLASAPSMTPDVWSPMASLLAPFRPTSASFTDHGPFLRADPVKIAAWQDWLNTLGPGPKVGLVWKSLIMDLQRQRHFPRLDEWAPVLSVPGLQFIALQYGDVENDLGQFEAIGKTRLVCPPNLNLKDDLDDLAALTCALDLMLGPPNATTHLAAACGADVGFIVSPNTWTLFGTDHYPAYPQARAFAPERFTDRAPMMQAVADRVRKLTNPS